MGWLRRDADAQNFHATKDKPVALPSKIIHFIVLPKCKRTARICPSNHGRPKEGFDNKAVLIRKTEEPIQLGNGGKTSCNLMLIPFYSCESLTGPITPSYP